MIIKRIFNNNAIMCVNAKGQEEVALGKGLGYQKKIGDPVDERLISKLFQLKNKSIIQKLEQLLDDIPVEYIVIATDIIHKAQKKFCMEFSEICIISLSDHIYASIQRKKEGLTLKNDLLWEIKRFYPDEYEIGVQAVGVVEEKFHVDLGEDEAAFIAMHILNAEANGKDTADTSRITKIIQEICNLVRHHFHIEFDSNSIYTYRFMTHLKFFAERMLKKTTYYGDGDEELLAILRVRYKNAYQCVEKIKKYLHKAYQYQISEEEETYLIIHIQRVVYKAESDDKGV